MLIFEKIVFRIDTSSVHQAPVLGTRVMLLFVVTKPGIAVGTFNLHIVIIVK
jgi:hypothetical protein